MLDDLDKLLIDLNVLHTHVLTIFQWYLYAEFV